MRSPRRCPSKLILSKRASAQAKALYFFAPVRPIGSILSVEQVHEDQCPACHGSWNSPSGRLWKQERRKRQGFVRRDECISCEERPAMPWHLHEVAGRPPRQRSASG